MFVSLLELRCLRSVVYFGVLLHLLRVAASEFRGCRPHALSFGCAGGFNRGRVGFFDIWEPILEIEDSCGGWRDRWMGLCAGSATRTGHRDLPYEQRFTQEGGGRKRVFGYE